MEAQSILVSDYLDLLFRARNKTYGGYELRKNVTLQALPNERAGSQSVRLFVRQDSATAKKETAPMIQPQFISVLIRVWAYG